ncbi:MAG: ATP-binding protein, partial [Muribaculaceae bacterium]|nr:ATP-binding protein [Muribaculaceae bacterium]
PVGIQTFSEIIKEGYIYIDKTKLIYELVTEKKYVFLSRPRRFGKSLLMSTLESYFKGEKDLFSHLEISRLEKDWSTYPVFRFDLSQENFMNTDRLIWLISRQLSRIEKSYGLKSNAPTIGLRFSDLIEQAYEKIGKKVVILIDEYDKPMLDCLHEEELHDKIKAELRGFYSCIKGNDQYIKFAMLTGITKFGKVSVFSGINNLKDISLLPRYNAICGISETEFHRDFQLSVDQFANVNRITPDDTWSKFKEMYDGYHFSSKNEDIYNPFSVLNAFQDNELKSYWYGSGSPSYLIRLIETNTFSLDVLEGAQRNELELSDISNTSSDIVPFLYQSGYLTIKDYNPDTEEYTLGFPNKEVYKAFWESLYKNFFRGYGGRSPLSIRDSVKDLMEGRPDNYMIRMQSLFADTDSTHERNKEIHFQNMMAIAAKMMGLAVRTEVHSSKGRCDMQILTQRYIYIFEFKINESPEKALKQIYNSNYLMPFTADNRTKFLIGANFLTKTRTIGSWLIEKLSTRGL